MVEFDSFLREFQQETDRAAAVLAVAYLDNRLAKLLRSKFVSQHKLIDSLFDGQGGLSSFSAKISLAFAVGLISLPTAEDLHLIRKIRNDFAHKPHSLSFQAPLIANYVSKLSVFKTTVYVNTDEKSVLLPFVTPRSRFNLAVVLLLSRIIEEPDCQKPAFREEQSHPCLTLNYSSEETYADRRG
jgi:DNA-binding MltR family transcriptional regulator